MICVINGENLRINLMCVEYVPYVISLLLVFGLGCACGFLFRSTMSDVDYEENK